MLHFSEGESRKEKDQELKLIMKKLENKYAALQVVPVIDKLGNPKVSSACLDIKCYSLTENKVKLGHLCYYLRKTG